MIFYKKGYKYQLNADVSIKVAHFYTQRTITADFLKLSGGRLFFKKGYAWDGASGPVFDTKKSMQATLVHDGLYQLIREKKLPFTSWKKADYELERIGKLDGMSSLRIWYWLLALRYKKGKATKKKKRILSAP